MHFLLHLLFISIVDYTSVKLTKTINKTILIDDNTRWFFIHSIGNFFISYKAIPDLCNCFKDPINCHKLEWSNNSFDVYYLSMIMHFYHSVFFKLNKADFIHHLVMCGICGPITFYQKKLIAINALFFLTGFPGCLDYFLLYLVKINKLAKNTEKIIYVYLTTWIRSPGLCCITLLSLYGLKDYYNTDFIYFIVSLLNLSLVFWNGQYYMMRTCIDYGYKMGQISYTKKNDISPSTYKKH